MAFKLKSHPDYLLKDHLEQALSLGMSRFDENGVFPEYKDLLRVILAFHDLGKASSFFQAYLIGVMPQTELTRHSEISALWTYIYCKNILKSSTKDALFAYICVRSHHANLSNIRQSIVPQLKSEQIKEINKNIDYDELNRIFKQLGAFDKIDKQAFEIAYEEINHGSFQPVFRRIKSSFEANDWLVLQYLFSILLWADKYSAIFARDIDDRTPKRWETEYLDRYKAGFSAEESAINHIRNEAYESLVNQLTSENRIYSMNMPTGSGKTISSLKVALELLEKDQELQRIIYCLPFTSVIDQNHSVFEDILKKNHIEKSSKLLLAHHHLSDFTYFGEDEYSQDESSYLVETWESQLVVTTFVQLLNAALSVKNSDLKRLHRLSNSVIILDEVQNIPHRYWLLLRSVLKTISKELNSVIILVTATLPMIFEQDEIKELASSSKEWFQSLNRVELHTQYVQEPMQLKELKEIVLDERSSNPDANILVILNTIQSSIDLYELLKQKLSESSLIYLSSNVVPKDRLDRINDFKDSNPKGKIIVSTQVVEAGVDIDMDVVFRDLAPLDSIIQASGRCNRNAAKQRSKVVLFQLFGKRNTPLWRYIYDETLVHATRSIIQEQESPICEPDFHQMSQNYYQRLKRAGAQDESRSILNNMKELQFQDALDYHPKENPKAFHLIESRDLQRVFLARDAEAMELLKEYRSFNDQQFEDIFEKRIKLKSVLRKMGAYMINTDKRYVKTDDAIFIVEKDELDIHYDLITGFKREHDQANYMF